MGVQGGQDVCAPHLCLVSCCLGIFRPLVSVPFPVPHMEGDREPDTALGTGSGNRREPTPCLWGFWGTVLGNRREPTGFLVGVSVPCRFPFLSDYRSPRDLFSEGMWNCLGVFL